MSEQKEMQTMSVDRRLLAGDLTILLLFGVGGLAFHGTHYSWLSELLRILSPFLLGYFAVAFALGGLKLPSSGPSFALSSAACWLLGIGAAMLLRMLLEGRAPHWSFVGVTYLFTGVLLLPWRALFWFRSVRKSEQA